MPAPCSRSSIPARRHSPPAPPAPVFRAVGPFMRKGIPVGRRLEATGTRVQVVVDPDGILLVARPDHVGLARARIPVLLEGPGELFAPPPSPIPPPAAAEIRLSFDHAERLAEAMSAWAARRDEWPDVFARRSATGRIVLVKLLPPGGGAKPYTLSFYDRNTAGTGAGATGAALIYSAAAGVRAQVPVEVVPGVTCVAKFATLLRGTVGELWSFLPSVELRVMRGEVELRGAASHVRFAPEDAPLVKAALEQRAAAATPPPATAPTEPQVFVCGDDSSWDALSEEMTRRLRARSSANSPPNPPPATPAPSPQPAPPTPPAPPPSAPATVPNPALDAAIRRFQALISEPMDAAQLRKRGLSGQGVFPCPAPRSVCGDGLAGCRLCGDTHMLVLELATAGPGAGLPGFRIPKCAGDVTALEVERARQEFVSHGTEWSRSWRR